MFTLPTKSQALWGVVIALVVMYAVYHFAMARRFITGATA